MRKFFNILICLIMAFATSTVMADDRVEINFCVGDSALIINGSEVTVEKPYVVGEGVTLVPIRVITEAFGVDVEWVAETKTVRLNYPDVNIVIQIDNPVAEVNDKAETLLAAPQLTEAGYTMIPLRFISENFGAEVSYDEDTARITVIKEKIDDDADYLKGSVDNKYIGDSFYGWSMENPMDMTMYERSFEGMETSFGNDENEIYIGIYTYEDEYNFDNDYNELKMSFSGLSLVKADKDTSNEKCKKMHFAGKDRSIYVDQQVFVTPEYIYSVTGYLTNDDTKTRDGYLNLLSTFECFYRNDDVYDMSNVNDGFRRFEAEHLGFSFDVPENLYMATSDETENDFQFYEIVNGISKIVATVYSKDGIGTAETLANEDYNHNKKILNESVTKFSDEVVQKKYRDITAFEYNYDIDTNNRKEHSRDVYFEVGEYIYNITVSIELPHDNYEEYIDKIINSVKAEPINSNDIGVLMRNLPVATGEVEVKVGKANIKLPNVYVEMATDETGVAYLGSLNSVMVTAMKIPASDMTENDIKKMMLETEINTTSDGDSDVLKSTYQTTINGQKYYAFLVSSESDEGMAYMEQYATLYKGYVYVVGVVCPELSYSESTKDEIEKIVKSITLE